MPLEVQEAFLMSKSERNVLNQFIGFVSAKVFWLSYKFIMTWWYLRSWQPRNSYISYKVLDIYARIDPDSIPGSGRSPEVGNGNPLHYSCLENPMDGEAWQATVHGVAKSWTWLSDFTFFSMQWEMTLNPTILTFRGWMWLDLAECSGQCFLF